MAYFLLFARVMNALRIRLRTLFVVSLLLSSFSAAALPNLTPYQPSGWSDKIVVSTVTGTSTDSSPLTTADTLYVDWAVANFGTASAGSFQTSLYVDGVLQTSWSSSSLPASSYTYVQDYAIGPLSAGSHTITITADSGNTVTESNESDNSYTKNITVGASSFPNLAPCQPAGWSDKIVVSTNTGTSTDNSPLLSTNTLYVDWAVTNNGSSTASNFSTALYVDGVFQNSWNTTSLAPGAFIFIQDYSIGSLSAGSHTVSITTDSSNTVVESSETDNTYTKNITVTIPPGPNLTPYQPAGWSDKIVVSTVTGTSTDSPSPTTADTLYVDWSVINDGTVSAGSFTTGLYVDGVLKNSWVSGSLGANVYTYVQDYSIGSLTAGSHTIQITADTGNTVAESFENDNSYSKMITVASATASAPTLTAPANAATNQSTTPAFSWSTVNGVTGYRIIVATNAADLPTSPSASSGGPSVVLNTTTTTNACTPTVPLNPATTYYWEVHGRNGGDDGNWSSVDSFTTGTPPSGLTIVPTYDNTITSDPQAATIEATINSAIAVYQANFSDPVTVNITFHKMSSGLGQSSGVYYQTISYSSYRAALASHATTADDATALTSLPNTANNPVTGDSNVNVKLALLRALGFSANPPVGQPDGTINLNLALMNLSQATNDPSKYSLFAAVSHEIDEVLGFSSELNGLTNGAPAPTGPVFPEDLFRYTQAGARSFTTDPNAASYFSLDGTTDLARFNQTASGDFQDWYSYYGGQTPEVQDAFGTAGATPVLGVELRALDAIGYTRVVAQAVITASAGTGGAISPAGTFNKNLGDNQLFTATPNTNYFVNQWLLDSTVVQTGGANYTLTNIVTNHTVQVTFTAKTNQTISFGALAGKNYGDPPFTVSATASSGLPVSFSILSGPATISNTTVTITGAGTVTVEASQAGSTTYNPATNVDQSFVVAKASQTISFGALPNKALGEPPFSVSATASSGLTVGFSILSGPATLFGTTVTLTNTGAVTVRSSQAGDANHNAAPNVDQSFTVYSVPSLALSPSGTNVIVSWSTNVPGFALFAATNLAKSSNWIAVLPSPVIIGNRYFVTNPTSGTIKTYRLKK